MDILDVGGFEQIETTEAFLLDREIAKRDHEAHLKMQLDALKAEGVKNPKLDYP